MSRWGGVGFQDAYFKVGEIIGTFHEGAMCLVVFILRLVLYGLIYVLIPNYHNTNRGLRQAKLVETVWRVVPRFCLIGLALPSLHLLYVMDEIGDPSICVKAVGHQWYWSYEFSAGSNVVGFDSFLERGDYDTSYRLLDVDQRIVAPVGTGIRWIIRRTDVIHSFALPRCMLKVDAVPGRINEISMVVRQSGVLYGQCSEICGANHRFMPIVVEFVPVRVYNAWWKCIRENSDMVIVG